MPENIRLIQLQEGALLFAAALVLWVMRFSISYYFYYTAIDYLRCIPVVPPRCIVKLNNHRINIFVIFCNTLILFQIETNKWITNVIKKTKIGKSVSSGSSSFCSFTLSSTFEIRQTNRRLKTDWNQDSCLDHWRQKDKSTRATIQQLKPDIPFIRVSIIPPMHTLI